MLDDAATTLILADGGFWNAVLWYWHQAPGTRGFVWWLLSTFVFVAPLLVMSILLKPGRKGRKRKSRRAVSDGPFACSKVGSTEGPIEKAWLRWWH
jgi:hypothetical protein